MIEVFEPTRIPPPALAWFVVAVHGRQESRVTEGLAEAGIEAWYPCSTRWHRTRKGREPRRQPLLAGYVFVGLELDRFGEYPFGRVVDIEGAIAFLGGANPREIPFGEPVADFDTAHREGAQRTLWEFRALEAMGVFDLTKDSRAGRAAKAAKVVLHSFVDLARAMATREEPEQHRSAA